MKFFQNFTHAVVGIALYLTISHFMAEPPKKYKEGDHGADWLEQFVVGHTVTGTHEDQSGLTIEFEDGFELWIANPEGWCTHNDPKLNPKKEN